MHSYSMPHSLQVCKEKALAYVENQQNEAALAVYLHYLADFPLDIEAHLDFATLCLQLGEKALGIEWAKKALDKAPTHKKVHDFLKTHYVIENRPAFDFLNNVELDSQSSYLHRAFFHYEKEAYGAALQILHAASPRSSAQANFFYVRAIIYFQLGFMDSGYQDVTAAIEHDPTRIEFFMLRARYYNAHLHVYKMLRDFVHVLALYEATPNTRLQGTYEGIQECCGMAIALLKEYDSLNDNPDDERYDVVYNEIRSLMVFLNSRDNLYRPASLLTTEDSLFISILSC